MAFRLLRPSTNLIGFKNQGFRVKSVPGKPESPGRGQQLAGFIAQFS